MKSGFCTTENTFGVSFRQWRPLYISRAKGPLAAEWLHHPRIREAEVEKCWSGLPEKTSIGASVRITE